VARVRACSIRKGTSVDTPSFIAEESPTYTAQGIYDEWIAFMREHPEMHGKRRMRVTANGREKVCALGALGVIATKHGLGGWHMNHGGTEEESYTEWVWHAKYGREDSIEGLFDLCSRVSGMSLEQTHNMVAVNDRFDSTFPDVISYVERTVEYNTAVLERYDRVFST